MSDASEWILVARFEAALSSGSEKALRDLLSLAIVVSSPVRHAAYSSADTALHLLSAVRRALGDIAYDPPMVGPSRAALPFKAMVGERRVEGLHLLRFDDAGMIVHLTVFLRPASGLEAARLAMLAALAGDQ